MPAGPLIAPTFPSVSTCGGLLNPDGNFNLTSLSCWESVTKPTYIPSTNRMINPEEAPMEGKGISLMICGWPRSVFPLKLKRYNVLPSTIKPVQFPPSLSIWMPLSLLESRLMLPRLMEEIGGLLKEFPK